MPPFDVQRRSEDGTTRVVVQGELDLATGPRVDEELRHAELERPERLVLDLHKVTFFDSTGLQVLLDTEVRAREEGRLFAVAAGDGEPRRILRLAAVADRLDFEEPGEAG